MARNIKYKQISKDLEKMAKPFSNSSIRPSLGLENSVGEFFFIPVEDLVPFRNQARKSFNNEEIQSLAESIKLHGIRQPLTILPVEGKYEVVSGERRLKAAKLIGLKKVPCIIINDSTQADSIALIENIHRKDLRPIELGITYRNLIEKKIFQNQADLAEKISVNKSQISEYIKYSTFDQDVQQYIINNKILSRDKLRAVLKAYENSDNDKIKKLIGMQPNIKTNFSILRIISNQGNIQTQESGINKLSPIQKQKLKEYLKNLTNNL